MNAEVKVTKKPEKKDGVGKKPAKKDNVNKKCKSCSMDCEVSRAILTAGMDMEKKNKTLANTFENEKPKFNRDSCPKK